MARAIHHSKRDREVERFNRKRLITRSLLEVKAFKIERLCGHFEYHVGLSRKAAEALVFTRCAPCEDGE